MANSIVGRKTHINLSDLQRLIVAEVMRSRWINERVKSKDKTVKVSRPMTIYAEGTMGIGKSQAIEQAVRILSNLTGDDFGLIDIRLAGMTGSDIQGIPVPVDINGKKCLKWLKDTLLPGIAEDCPKQGILFLDELNQVEDNSVKSLLYQLILDRKINDYRVPDGWFIVAAGNREEDGGVYNRLPAPIRDRMIIVEIDPDREQWIRDYARPHRVHPAVIAYLEEGKNADCFHTYDADKEREGDEKCENYVFATPRSWDMVSDVLLAYESSCNRTFGEYGVLMRKDDIINQIKGLIGDQLGGDFFNFYDNLSTLDIQSIYNLKWNNNTCDNPGISIIQKHYPYLVNCACYPAETPESIERSRNILLFLVYKEAPNNYVNIITNTYSAEQLKQVKSYILAHKCEELYASVKNQSNRFKEIEAMEDTGEEKVSLGK